ncbi:MAG TPA: CBS domain-containing protein [Pantanalinema sp.]
MQIRTIMTSPAHAVTPQTSIKDLLATFKDRQVSGFPVVEGDKVVGVVTESDLVYRDRPLKPPAFLALFDMVIPLETPEHLREEIIKTVGSHVGDVMTAPAVTISPDADVSEAASLMVERRINRLPVVDASGRLVGIVSRADLVASMA